jgi:hypothetical protein
MIGYLTATLEEQKVTEHWQMLIRSEISIDPFL